MLSRCCSPALSETMDPRRIAQLQPGSNGPFAAGHLRFRQGGRSVRDRKVAGSNPVAPDFPLKDEHLLRERERVRGGMAAVL
jgi:hypothetical protein